jgi:N-acetyl-gamma-glutamyl-phosphate reductase
MKRVFLDGSAGTTGLRIRERLAGRSDLTLVTLPEALRKDPLARKNMLNSCDLAILCLPDDAAREAAAMLENPDVVLLDTSTAHRTEPGWAYGFPELSPARLSAVLESRRIAVPGCHASGFLALVAPLTEAGLLPRDALLACTSLTGYSGGGKKMIAEYESELRDVLLDAPRQYGLSQQHKHLKEMTAVAGLVHPPVFCPIVADYYSGMEVTVPVFSQQLARGVTAGTIREFYRDFYRGPVVRYAEGIGGARLPLERLYANACRRAGRAWRSRVFGDEPTALRAVRRCFDNLGKGASGAAMECSQPGDAACRRKPLLYFEHLSYNKLEHLFISKMEDYTIWNGSMGASALAKLATPLRGRPLRSCGRTRTSERSRADSTARCPLPPRPPSTRRISSRARRCAVTQAPPAGRRPRRRSSCNSGNANTCNAERRSDRRGKDGRTGGAEALGVKAGRRRGRLHGRDRPSRCRPGPDRGRHPAARPAALGKTIRPGCGRGHHDDGHACSRSWPCEFTARRQDRAAWAASPRAAA